MADHHKEEEKKEESLMEKISDKINGHDSSSSSSSSDSDDDKKKKEKKKDTSSFKDKANRLFGREKPLHKVLGGGKAADVLLWRDKKTATAVLISATTIWVLFDVLEYHLLALICHCLIAGFIIFFIWSNATAFINKSPPPIPELTIPEEPVLRVASALRVECNKAIATLRDVAFGRDLKKFLGVIATLWVLSLIGNACDLLTLLFTITIMLFTVPIFYEKYEDKVDAFAEKAMTEVKKQYAAFDEKVLSKIPKGPLHKNTKKD